VDATLEKKYRALDDFIERVKRSPVGKDVARMILYGSLLRGEATPESDIDLLVVATGDVRAVEQTLGDIAFDVMLDHGELVSPMVYCPDEYRNPHYFVRSVKDAGEEVYAVDDEMARRQEAQDLLDLAQGFLTASRSLRGRKGNWRASIDLSYNAAELSVKGLLLIREGGWPKSHSGVVQQFSKAFVLEDRLVEPEVGRALRQSLELRNKARYDPHATLTREDADYVIGLAVELIGILQQELAR